MASDPKEFRQNFCGNLWTLLLLIKPVDVTDTTVVPR